VIGVDRTEDIIIYIVIGLFILASTMKILPAVIPLPATLAIIGINYLFIHELALLRAMRFYFASVLGLQYATTGTAGEITAAISWFLHLFNIHKERELYTIIATTKRFRFSKLNLKQLPEWIVSLLKEEIKMDNIHIDTLHPPKTIDIVMVIISAVVVSFTILS
jgi:hypothetical protein